MEKTQSWVCRARFSIETFCFDINVLNYVVQHNQYSFKGAWNVPTATEELKFLIFYFFLKSFDRYCLQYWPWENKPNFKMHLFRHYVTVKIRTYDLIPIIYIYFLEKFTSFTFWSKSKMKVQISLFNQICDSGRGNLTPIISARAPPKARPHPWIGCPDKNYMINMVSLQISLFKIRRNRKNVIGQLPEN